MKKEDRKGGKERRKGDKRRKERRKYWSPIL